MATTRLRKLPVWHEVARVTGRQAAETVRTGLCNALGLKPAQYEVLAVESQDTRFTYAVRVRGDVSAARREQAGAFARGVEYTWKAFS